MNERRLELARRRGMLQAHIAEQRREIGRHMAPIESLLARGDQARAGIDWLKQHPKAVGVAVTALFVLRPRRTWRLARRGIVLWQGWKTLQNSLSGHLGL